MPLLIQEVGDQPYNLAICALAVSLTLAYIISVSRKSFVPDGTKGLPGPKGFPVVGNAFDIPKTHPWLKFEEWAKEFGPLYQVKAFGTTLVIISKESIANDLLSLRGAIYSDRPELIMPTLITDNGFLGAIRLSEYWRRSRRFAQAMLSTKMVAQTVPKQTTEARQMVVDLAKAPSKYAYWLERAGVMTSIKQIYGVIEERGAAEENHVHEIVSYMENIDRVSTPGAYLVEFLPFLLHLPTFIAPFKREAGKLVKRHWKYLSSLVQQSTNKYESGTSELPESFARKYLQAKEDWKLSDREIVWILSSIYGGAAGTSATAVQTIILNTCLFPEWQDRIQKELDSVVGNDRLPDFNDFENLPKLRAVIKESMRWRPVLPAGFPHSVTKNDVYNGYHIPQGAVIIPNQWAILRDDLLYPNPDTFEPGRWLEPGFPTYREPLTQYPNLKKFVGFGHGRRICPGLEVAEKAIVLQTASLYWACNIVRKRDSSGKEMDIPWYDYTGIAISAPRSFPFAVEERVKGRLAMMEQSATTDHAEELSLANGTHP